MGMFRLSATDARRSLLSIAGAGGRYFLAVTRSAMTKGYQQNAEDILLGAMFDVATLASVSVLRLRTRAMLSNT